MAIDFEEPIPSWKQGVLIYNEGAEAFNKGQGDLSYWLFQTALLQENISPELIYLAHHYSGNAVQARQSFCEMRLLMGDAQCQKQLPAFSKEGSRTSNDPLVMQADEVIAAFEKGADGSAGLKRLLEKLRSIPEMYPRCSKKDFRKIQPLIDSSLEWGGKALSSYQQKLPLPYTMVMLYLMREALLEAAQIENQNEQEDSEHSEILENLDLMEALDKKEPIKMAPGGAKRW